MAVMAALTAVVDTVRVLAMAVQGKITTKVLEVGQSIWDNSPCRLHVEVSNDLSYGYFFG